jgi:hypothetical protein
MTSTGCTPIARCAGTMVAAAAATIRRSGAVAYVGGSWIVMP